MSEQKEVKIVVFGPSYEGLGMVVEYLSKFSPFSGHTANHFVSSVSLHLWRQQNLVAIRDSKIVGYAGWLETSNCIGQDWINESGPLKQIDGGDAAALTTVVSQEAAIVRRLIRGARTLYSGKNIYFKRDYKYKPSKKARVLNQASIVTDR